MSKMAAESSDIDVTVKQKEQQHRLRPDSVVEETAGMELGVKGHGGGTAEEVQHALQRRDRGAAPEAFSAVMLRT